MVTTRVAVFASGGGSNFQALIDRFAGGTAGVDLACLVASRRTAGAIDRARAAGIPVAVVPDRSEEEEERPREAEFLDGTLSRHGIDLIVLAGYLRLVPAPIVTSYWGRIINIHPALLPAFGGPGMYGTRVHASVLERGARVTGVTVHFVDEAYDRGPILAQWPVPVLEDDTVEGLASRVLEVEHRVLPDVVAALAGGDVWLGSDGRVRWRRPWFGGEEFKLVRRGEDRR